MRRKRTTTSGAGRITDTLHFSIMNNAGSEAARGDILLFLNDDVEPLRPDWLNILVEDCSRPGIGVVGAQLLYPSGTIQHAGIALGLADGCGHVGRGLCRSSYWPWLDMTRDVSAVTGARLAIPAGIFRGFGGFRDIFPINLDPAVQSSAILMWDML